MSGIEPAGVTRRRPAQAWRTIVLAGLVAGALDLAYIILFYAFRGVAAARVVQGIAAGLIGREAAAKGGADVVAAGVAIHFAIALVVAAVFFALSRKLRWLVERPLLGGAIYGVAVWLVMNLAVLPLTATPPKTFPSPVWLPVLVAHIACVGVPIAVVTRRLSGRAER